MATEVTIRQLMEGMPKAFIPEKATGVSTVIQYHLTGPEGGDWVVNIRDGQCAVVPGTTPNPNLTLTADAQDYKDIITGKTNAMAAFMQGKVKLAGDLNMAMKMTSFFKM